MSLKVCEQGNNFKAFSDQRRLDDSLFLDQIKFQLFYFLGSGQTRYFFGGVIKFELGTIKV